jgi:hypothetical protein
MLVIFYLLLPGMYKEKEMREIIGVENLFRRKREGKGSLNSDIVGL